ncbi:MAG: hypothetical protein CMH28_06970 [Micavibrio sp.]|nr:hypothetical protein [Micavibrio sp.]|tara:strand:+ start:213 stop:644 length:432 start_codon:yes stop_codon:yes gene_type:complete
MARLDSLIRVKKHRVDEKQKALGRLYREMEELQAEKQTVLDAQEKERLIAEEMASDVSVQQSYAAFKERVKARLNGIKQKEARLETRILVAQDDMKDAFADLKKVEIVDENRKEKEKKERLKKENETLDEIGITRFLEDSDQN